MAGPVLDASASLTCPHGGKVQIIPTHGRALAYGMPLATVGDVYLVVSCPSIVGNVPHPCVRVQWTAPAVRLLVNKLPAVAMTSGATCWAIDGSPQGPPIVVTAQPRVSGT